MTHYLKALVTKANADQGTFTAVASMPTLDRDREVLAKGALRWSEETLPILAFHNFADPVGRGRPYYSGDALMVDGWFGDTERASEIRQLVVGGVLTNMSVGFMDAERKQIDGVTTITDAELLEISFVAIPSNREAAVLAARGYGGGMTVADARRIANEMMLDLARLHLDEARRALARSDAAKATIARLDPSLDFHDVLADAKAFLADLARKDR